MSVDVRKVKLLEMGKELKWVSRGTTLYVNSQVILKRKNETDIQKTPSVK